MNILGELAGSCMAIYIVQIGFKLLNTDSNFTAHLGHWLPIKILCNGWTDIKGKKKWATICFKISVSKKNHINAYVNIFVWAPYPQFRAQSQVPPVRVKHAPQQCSKMITKIQSKYDKLLKWFRFGSSFPYWPCASQALNINNQCYTYCRNGETGLNQLLYPIGWNWYGSELLCWQLITVVCLFIANEPMTIQNNVPCCKTHNVWNFS